MRRALAALAMLFLIGGAAALPAQPQPAAAPAVGAYRHFRAAIYLTVSDTRRLADRANFEREFARVSSQLRFDKVYIEAYRDQVFATDEELERVKAWFRERGIQVAGGITLAAGGQGGQFGTFDYENPADRAECERAVRTIARHFDEVILDDFFFYTSKSDADIAARGARSWTQYRLDRMRQVSQQLVLGPARAVNPHVRVIIKYPNWYEHFQGLGYDLDRQPRMFDGIYTGTETRDPEITDQLLQQYESYEIIRYFDNVAPGRNGGGWVDTYSTRSIDRYAEQLWDTLFARAPQIMLFNWTAMADPGAAREGDRSAWASRRTSFDWDTIRRAWHGEQPPGWARAAGAALDSADAVLGELGRPTGIASYKPVQSSGEDFLHAYLGNLGIPIELSPTFPADADTVLLTEAAAADPQIIARIRARLQAGGRVIVTSGFLAATQDRFQELAEWRLTGRRVLVDQYYDGFGAGNGASLSAPDGERRQILFPEIHFFTNDSWPIIRGVASARGFPMVLMNHYSRGTLLLWTMPENIGDLYNLPQPMVARIKAYLLPAAPVRVDAPSRVALFTYDNGAFIVENYRNEEAEATISIAGTPANLREITTGATLQPAAEPPPAPNRRGPPAPEQRSFRTTLQPHSFQVFRVGG
ncbi:MAG: hypothetical protein JO276_15525 [Sphingomonadaceae bacterium]|nr:hypothetical protein [Sphingomonadaceae bacterium]